MTFMNENLQKMQWKVDKTNTNYNALHFVSHNLTPNQVDKNKWGQRRSNNRINKVSLTSLYGILYLSNKYTPFVTKEHGTFHINWTHIIPQGKTYNSKIEAEYKQNFQTTRNKTKS